MLYKNLPFRHKESGTGTIGDISNDSDPARWFYRGMFMSITGVPPE